MKQFRWSSFECWAPAFSQSLLLCHWTLSYLHSHSDTATLLSSTSWDSRLFVSWSVFFLESSTGYLVISWAVFHERTILNCLCNSECMDISTAQHLQRTVCTCLSFPHGQTFLHPAWLETFCALHCCYVVHYLGLIVSCKQSIQCPDMQRTILMRHLHLLLCHIKGSRQARFVIQWSALGVDFNDLTLPFPMRWSNLYEIVGPRQGPAAGKVIS